MKTIAIIMTAVSWLSLLCYTPLSLGFTIYNTTASNFTNVKISDPTSPYSNGPLHAHSKMSIDLYSTNHFVIVLQQYYSPVLTIIKIPGQYIYCRDSITYFCNFVPGGVQIKTETGDHTID